MTTIRTKPINLIHEGSGQGRANKGLNDITISPTEASISANQSLINRVQGIVRNDGWIQKALRSDVANEIGTGIKPSPSSPYKKFNRDILELWDDHKAYMDFDGNLDVYGLQMLAAKSRKVNGGVFLKRSKGKHCYEWQVLEYEYCPLDKIQLHQGRDVRNGFEFNDKNKLVAYWIYNFQPSEYRNNGQILKLVRVPQEQVIHHFNPQRAGALRASSELSSCLTRANILSKYDMAELTRKENRASFTGVIKRDRYNEQDDFNFDPISGLPLKEDFEGVGQINLEAGTFQSLLAGEDLILFNGDSGNDGYTEFQRQQLMALAASSNVPYQVLSGDYNGVNDRALRVVLNQYYREVNQTQELIDIHQLCRKMWEDFVDDMVIRGKIKVRNYHINRFKYIRCDHIPDAFAYIHPVQDLQAMKLAVDEGFRSRKEAVRGRNRDVSKVDFERQEDLEREIALGIVKDAADIALKAKEVLDEFEKDDEDDENDENSNERGEK